MIENGVQRDNWIRDVDRTAESERLPLPHDAHRRCQIPSIDGALRPGEESSAGLGDDRDRG
jgi:hypothetical protein